MIWFIKQVIRKRIKHNFQTFKTIRSFGREILSLDDALELQIRLKNDIDILKESTKPVIDVNGKQSALNDFESGIFLKGKQAKGFASILDRVARIAKVSDHEQLKILTPKQMLQRLPLALTQVKAVNTSQNLLN